MTQKTIFNKFHNKDKIVKNLKNCIFEFFSS